MDASYSSEDADPYSPRSLDEYYGGEPAPSSSHADANSSARAPEPAPAPGTSSGSGASGARVLGEDDYPSSSQRARSTQPRQAAGAGADADEVDTDADEPLFGGTPFRDSYRANAGSAQGSGEEPAQDRERLYALLNVERDATEEQIREAYRSLAVSFHPDKHTDPALKSAAESRFREVQHAYEVLTNPQQRAVYDHLGEAGLKSSWALTVRGQTPADLQREFERQAMSQRMQEAENLVKSRGDFSLNLDASSLFAPSTRIPRPVTRAGEPVTFLDRWNRVGATQLIGKHGFETAITDRVSVNFAGQMVSRGGAGNGNLIGTVKTQWSPRLFSEVSATLLRPRIGTIKGQYVISPNSFLTFLVASQTTAVPPAITLTYGQRISSTSALTGFSSIKTGTYTIGPWGQHAPVLFKRDRAALTIGVSKQVAPDRGWTVQSVLNEYDPSVGGEYSARLLNNTIKARAGLGLGMGSGLSAFASAERRLTETTRLTLGVNCNIPTGGITLRVRIQRLGQKLNVPILISPYFRSDLFLLCTAVPAAAYTALHYGYLVPAKRQRISRKVAELRAQSRDMIEERYRAAVEAKALLRDSARKRAMSEKKKGGLVVVEAWYGSREAIPPRREGSPAELVDAVWAQSSSLTAEALDVDGVDVTTLPPVWDVTVAVQNLVTNGQLIIPGGRPKFGINGFFDPCMGERKHLVVRYVFRHQLHEVIVDDVSPLAAPLRIHQVL